MQVMQTGKGKSGFYRFLTKGQQWIWLQTDFCVSYHQFNAKPEYVICTHKAIDYINVLKQHKEQQRHKTQFPLHSNSKSKSPKASTITLRNLDSSKLNNDTVRLTPTSSSGLCASDAAGAVGSTGGVGASGGGGVASNDDDRTCGISACDDHADGHGGNEIGLDNAGGTSGLGNSINIMNDILSGDTSTSLDTVTIWTNASTPTGAAGYSGGTRGAGSASTCQLNQSLKTSRPASSYGNISSTGISPNIKRKRYFCNNRGNESDSTSMSADSTTSRNSLITHLSAVSLI